MKPCVKVYELVKSGDDVKKTLIGIYKNMAVVKRVFKTHYVTVSNICHNKNNRRWVTIDGKTYTFKFTDKMYTKTD